ncbi:MAG TPA: ferritin-like domain-containing protein [Roseiflexaceae bacterium]|nr:ferritin-like domain-containing protein [Roseiflexaceae bacterium]
MAKLNTLEDLFIEELQDLYDAEHQITKALPKMAKAAASSELQQAFEMHLQQTEQQIKRLEQVFDSIGQKAKGKTCEAMKGIIKEGSELMSERAAAEVMDAGLIASAQRVEHYEMAGYGSVRTWAQQLGHSQAAKLLQQTLDEEGQTDKKLTQIAESMVNTRAASA